MRIPQVLDFNTHEAYSTSKASANLIGERKQQICSENFTWDKEFIPTLAKKCLQVLADNFKNSPCLDVLNGNDRDHIEELISPDLPIKMAIKIIKSEVYWRRRYQHDYNDVPYQTHLGWTWKCIYLEQYARLLIENAEPEYKDEETFGPILNLCSPFVHTLFITQLQQWKRPNTILLKELPKETPCYHISFIPILKHLPDLVQLEICFGMNNVETEYDCHMFKIAVEDCEKLGEAMLKLRHLRILRLHKSEIKCKHVQGLVKKLLYNTSLVELDLSNCKIGNLGAKCIGKLLTVHESLKVLKLTNNVIEEQGIWGIAWGIVRPEGAHLRVLDLSLNPLGGPGCAMLMRSLIRGLLPQELAISQCSVHEDCTHYVTCMLRVNTSLQRLDISGNVFGEKGGIALLASMEMNRSLLELDMRNTCIPVEIQNEISVLLKRNFDANQPIYNFRNKTNVHFIDVCKQLNTEESDQVVQCLRSHIDNNSSLRNYLVGHDRMSVTSSVKSDPTTIRSVHIQFNDIN